MANFYTRKSQSQSNASKDRIVVSKEDWQSRIAEMQIDRDDLNRLVMDYLVIEGFKDSAENFARESGLAPTVDLDSIEYRMGIKNAIQRGDVDEAITKVNDLNPEILDQNPDLFFHLQQQRMIEYIRHGQIAEALAFAQQELAPRGEENPVFLSELERTMALLAFDTSLPANGPTSATNPNAPPPHIQELLLPSQRQRTAGQLNSAILTSQSHGKDPKLPNLLRMMIWGDSLLSARADFYKPDLADLLNRTEPGSSTNLPTEPPPPPHGETESAMIVL
ncbi:hypothetical protein PTTG_06172 [Puccinia triticina 1-1 BBBD Race 1]|uniref:CTLH domain-containing protein n=2 Tax=Puccinia triticina TaxID=208348 RepID=A0A180GDH7_PUCT1|nr:uncharacterized protein PtA15_7A69 [Puccinia triticina]OAV90589.1 hypothetical protein PTTG_06172 [Puccinia triticina 1-1 BBBD Race 1]WAQ86343.1 hypothetical protein PtA15_7A69 [Puccinia triticina]